jgi:hypothetical protein
VNDLHDRAAGVLGTEDGRICWSYGMSASRPDQKRKDPDRYEQRQAQRRAGKEGMVSWVKRYGLK